MGSAFRLRDRGRLEESLRVCQEAIGLARPVDPATPNPSSFGSFVVGALTLADVARRLGRSEIAREPLETALAMLNSVIDIGSPSWELIRTQRQVRAHLEEIHPAC